eukprot:1315095-Prymnesium_polylepis.1
MLVVETGASFAPLLCDLTVVGFAQVEAVRAEAVQAAASAAEEAAEAIGESKMAVQGARAAWEVEEAKRREVLQTAMLDAGREEREEAVRRAERRMTAAHEKAMRDAAVAAEHALDKERAAHSSQMEAAAAAQAQAQASAVETARGAVAAEWAAKARREREAACAQ